MKKVILFCFFSIFFILSFAQPRVFEVPIETERSGDEMVGYYHPQLENIFIDIQNKNSITHYMFDTSFKLINQCNIEDKDRSLNGSLGRAFFVKSLNIRKDVFEIYQHTSDKENVMWIYKLDMNSKTDSKVAEVKFGQRYKSETLFAVAPSSNGCRFLCVSTKKDVIVIYNWSADNNSVAISESELPESSLNLEERNKWKKYARIKYRDLFSDLSITDVNNPNNLEFPNAAQFFYNDSTAYVVQRHPNKLGINVFTIDLNSAASHTRNIWLNQFKDGMQELPETPICTINGNTLIILNSSDESFQYFFYDLVSGKLLNRYESPVDDRLYRLVHSPLHQYGTYGDAKQEKTLTNEKRFIRRMNAESPFIKSSRIGDSLVVFFGGFNLTTGIEGTLLAVVSSGLSSAALWNAGPPGMHYYAYLVSYRNKFLYAYSKFSLSDLQPSTSNNVDSYIDKLVEDGKIGKLEGWRTFCFEINNRIIICRFIKSDKKLKVTQY